MKRLNDKINTTGFGNASNEQYDFNKSGRKQIELM